MEAQLRLEIDPRQLAAERALATKIVTKLAGNFLQSMQGVTTSQVAGFSNDEPILTERFTIDNRTYLYEAKTEDGNTCLQTLPYQHINARRGTIGSNTDESLVIDLFKPLGQEQEFLTFTATGAIPTVAEYGFLGATQYELVTIPFPGENSIFLLHFDEPCNMLGSFVQFELLPDGGIQVVELRLPGTVLADQTVLIMPDPERELVLLAFLGKCFQHLRQVVAQLPQKEKVVERLAKLFESLREIEEEDPYKKIREGYNLKIKKNFN